jgi:hypothetical protein
MVAGYCILNGLCTCWSAGQTAQVIPKYGQVLVDAHGREGDVTLAAMGGVAGAVQEAPLSTRITGIVGEAQPNIVKIVNGQGVQGCRPSHPVHHRGGSLNKEGGSRPQGKQLAHTHPHGLVQYVRDARSALVLLGG